MQPYALVKDDFASTIKFIKSAKFPLTRSIQSDVCFYKRPTFSSGVAPAAADSLKLGRNTEASTQLRPSRRQQNEARDADWVGWGGGCVGGWWLDPAPTPPSCLCTALFVGNNNNNQPL